MNKGILTKVNGFWEVKWSDLHSFTHGTHWMYTKLSNDSNSIKYIKDNEVRYGVLKEGLEVEFEIVTAGYDEENFTPFNSAKLIFPEVEEFVKEQFIKEYVIKNNPLFRIKEITTIRDGGTIVLMCEDQRRIFYIHKHDYTLHNDYPPTKENLIIDKPTQVYILDRLDNYKKDCEFNLTQTQNIIKKIQI
jgi:hypothetical protein